MILNLLKIWALNLIVALATILPQSTLSIGVANSTPRSFLPHLAESTSEQMVSQMLFRSLFKYEGGQLVKDLVEDWSLSESNRVYTFKLKENIYWQDGTPITSDDVIYTLTLQTELKDQIDIDKIGIREIQVTLPTPTAILPTILTFGIEPSHLQNQDPLNPIGSTSFRLARILRERETIEGVILQSFQRNKQYNRVVLRFYPSEDNLETAYKLGEINTFISNKNFNLATANRIPLQYRGRFFSLVFNTEREGLRDIETRTVLANAIKPDELLTRNFYTNATIAIGPISYSAYTRDYPVDSRTTNLQLSSTQYSLLPSVEILLPNSQEGRQIESYLREKWGSGLNLNLKIEYLPLDDLIERGKKGKFSVLFIGYEVSPDPDRYVFWHSTQIGKLNLAHFSDLRADKALEEGRLDFDYPDRFRHYSIFQDVMETKIPAIFLYHPGTYLYTAKHIKISLPQEIYTPVDIIKNL